MSRLSAEERAILDSVKVVSSHRKKKLREYQDEWRQPGRKTARGGGDIRVAKQIVDEVVQRYARQMSGAAQSGAGRRVYTPCRCAKCRKR